MTLFDTDKNNLDRGSPDPNRPDLLIESSVKNHGTNSFNIVTDASSGQFLVNNVGSLRLIAEGTTSVVSDFTASDGTYGFTNSQGALVVHNLGYVPIVQAYIIDSMTGFGGGYTQLPYTVTNGPNLAAGSNLVIWTLSVQADATNLYVVNQLVTYGSDTSTITTPAVTVKYYLFQETAN